MKQIIFFIISSFVIANTLRLPSDIGLCHKSDKNFNSCLRLNIREAIKKFAQGNETLGISKLEPYFVKTLDIEFAQGGSLSLKQKYDNLYFHGITTFCVEKIVADLMDDKCSLQFNYLVPNLQMLSDYELKGKILLFPLDSKGKCKVTLHDLHTVHNITCERYKKSNGKSHLKITNYNILMTPGKVEYNFTNLIPGNEQLDNQILKAVNENGLQVFGDIKSGFEKSFSIIYMTTMNNLFSKVAENDMFLD